MDKQLVHVLLRFHKVDILFYDIVDGTSGIELDTRGGQPPGQVAVMLLQSAERIANLRVDLTAIL